MVRNALIRWAAAAIVLFAPDTWASAAGARLNVGRPTRPCRSRRRRVTERIRAENVWPPRRVLTLLIRYLCHDAISEHSRAKMEPPNLYCSRNRIAGARAGFGPGPTLIKTNTRR